MIHEILSPQQCADCKGCCFFDRDDAWEAPAPLLPEHNGMSACTHLTERGCALGEGKPAECAMYPFRVMRLGQYKVIALCKYCKAVMDLPLSEIVQFVERKQEQFLSVGVVKEYNDEYIILKII